MADNTSFEAEQEATMAFEQARIASAAAAQDAIVPPSKPSTIRPRPKSNVQRHRAKIAKASRRKNR